jgi:uncharacterized protein
MLNKLPTWIEPKRLATDNSRLKGAIALTQMSRLQDSLSEMSGEVYIDWLFTLDDKQRPLISGQTQAQLSILCQRCLQPMLVPVEIPMALVIFFHEPREDEQLLPNYEVITLPNSQVSLVGLIEDELILALPQVVKHDRCPSNQYQLSDNGKNNFRQNNSFQVLSKLKSEHEKDNKKRNKNE